MVPEGLFQRGPIASKVTAMDMTATASHRLPLVALAVLAGAGLSAAAFHGWMRYGSDMLVTLAETGLSGCL